MQWSRPFFYLNANGPYILYAISFKYGFSRLEVLPIDFDISIASFSKFLFEKLVLLTLRSIKEWRTILASILTFARISVFK